MVGEAGISREKVSGILGTLFHFADAGGEDGDIELGSGAVGLLPLDVILAEAAAGAVEPRRKDDAAEEVAGGDEVLHGVDGMGISRGDLRA